MAILSWMNHLLLSIAVAGSMFGVFAICLWCWDCWALRRLKR